MGEIAGVLLAGGQSRRMGGGDKPLRLLAGRPILDHVLERVRPQVGPLLLNVNGDPARFAAYGLPVASDVVEGYAGPLAGILTGMEWARVAHPGCEWLASFACDAPFLPRDLVPRLLSAVLAEEADMACAASGGRSHPVFALWPLHLADELRQAMLKDSIRKVDQWTARYRLVAVDWPSVPRDPFFNTNRPEDLVAAERLMQ